MALLRRRSERLLAEPLAFAVTALLPLEPMCSHTVAQVRASAMEQHAEVVGRDPELAPSVIRLPLVKKRQFHYAALLGRQIADAVVENAPELARFGVRVRLLLRGYLLQYILSRSGSLLTTPQLRCLAPQDAEQKRAQRSAPFEARLDLQERGSDCLR